MSIQPDVEVLVVVTTEQIDHHTAPDFKARARGKGSAAAKRPRTRHQSWWST